MKIGLYSITYLGLWYRGEPLTLEQLIPRARELGYDGVEIDGKRPHGNPLDLDAHRRRDLRSLAQDQGIEIYAVAANNDFSCLIPEQLEAQIAYVRELIRMASDLGAPVLRMFAAWPGVTVWDGLGRYDITRRLWQSAHELEPRKVTWERIRQALAESARYASDAGVTLALQNHPPVIETHSDLLRMIRDVDSPALRACLDAPLVAKYEGTLMLDAAKAVGDLQVLSHFGGEYDRGPDGEIQSYTRTPDWRLRLDHFYPDFVAAMRTIGYRGYMGYELCHPLPSVNGSTVGRDFVDRNAALAADYMRGLIGSAKS